MHRARTLVMLAVPALACTRPNPAFDSHGTETGNADTEPGDTDVDTSDDVIEEDMPTDAPCALQPTPGLAISFGDSARFGGVCPTGIDIWTRVVEAGGGQVVLDVCPESCDGACFNEPLTLSTFPLLIDDYLPLDTCLRAQAATMWGEDGTSCLWGALTIWDPLFVTPYVVATAHSSPPTPAGADLLAGAVPDARKGFSCNCDAVGQSNDCCYAAESPSFWFYPIGEQEVYAGEYAPLNLPNQAGLQHHFKLYQAEFVTTCEVETLQTSWAVVGQLP